MISGTEVAEQQYLSADNEAREDREPVISYESMPTSAEGAATSIALRSDDVTVSSTSAPQVSLSAAQIQEQAFALWNSTRHQLANLDLNNVDQIQPWLIPIILLLSPLLVGYNLYYAAQAWAARRPTLDLEGGSVRGQIGVPSAATAEAAASSDAATSSTRTTVDNRLTWTEAMSRGLTQTNAMLGGFAPPIVDGDDQNVNVRSLESVVVANATSDAVDAQPTTSVSASVSRVQVVDVPTTATSSTTSAATQSSELK
jgi:hypothetical protein